MTELSYIPDLDSVDSVLEHHGVKGQKWGVRRSKVSLQSAHEDAANAMAAKHKIKTGGAHTLSNKELQSLVTRMNLEQQYSKLASQKATNPGAKFAKELLLNVGKQQASKALSDVVTKQVTAALKK